MKKDSIAIIGLGKVGTALGHLLHSAGYPIAAVADQSDKALDAGMQFTGGRRCHDPAEAASLADAVFITTTDDSISSVCTKLAESDSAVKGKKIVHVSGAGGLDLLESARRKGARVASIHPLQSFADVAGAIENIPGSTFGITAQAEIEGWAQTLVRDLGGKPVLIAEEDKPLYHAAACIVSNYLVALMHTGERIYQHLGIEPDEALQSFWPLVKGTIRNIESRGVSASLTGPIARGDTGTIRTHLAVLETKMPALLSLYRELGAVTADVAREGSSLSLEKAKDIKNLLKGDRTHEHTRDD